MRYTPSCRAARVAAGLSIFGASALVLPLSASASGGFTAGDLVVYTVAGTTSTSYAVNLNEYSPSVTSPATTPLVTVALPTATSGGNYELTDSGSATFDGELNLSSDGTTLVAGGYTAAPGVTKITSAKNTPRTVALVSAAGTVNSSTSLADSTTEGQNFRTAISTAAGPTSLYVGGGAGVGVTPTGGTSAGYANTDNVHDVQIVDGNLYESTTTGINEVGSSGLPTGTATVADVALALTGAPANFEPAAFSLVTLGAGPGPDTLYVADNNNNPTSPPVTTPPTAPNNNQIEKYTLQANGTWAYSGAIPAQYVSGLTVSVSGGTATIYATDSSASLSSAGPGTNNQLISFTDTSGLSGTLAGTPTVIADAPASSSFRGVAFAPTAAPVQTPEVPWAPALLLIAAAGFGGSALLARRRRTA